MGKKMLSSILISIIISIMELNISSLASNSTLGCIEAERKALLRFKSSLEDPSNRLSSWNQKNKHCCAWHGVMCDNIKKHVTKLDLSNKLTLIDYMLRGKTIDSSLLELKHLQYLDLSWSDFEYSKIPLFLSSMKQLQHLNLSWGNFNGSVPHNLGHLSSLRTLDLSGGGNLIIRDLTWAANLSSLEYLDMSNVDLSSTKDITKVLRMLPSLVVLRLSRSKLDRTQLPDACVNSSLLTNVEYLDLSYNNLDGEFPCFFSNMTSLKFLDISENMLNFSGTHLLRLKNLAHLNLAYNKLHHKAEWISEFLLDRCHLKSLNLMGNSLYGDISEPFKNLSGCWRHNLENLSLAINKFYGRLPEELGEFEKLMHLDLSLNSVSGHIPTSLGKMSGLTELDLSFNSLSGPIPSSFGNLRSLRLLNLQSNQLSGEIPISLGQLANLESIDISFNSVKGTLLEAHFANLSKLKYLLASSTMLKFGMGYDWVTPFQLKYLTMSSTKIGGKFPQWLQTQKALTHMDLSNCSITGTLPNRLHFMNLIEVDLSHNSITGPIPELPSTLTSLDLSSNKMTHGLPSNIGHMMPLLQKLVLSRNFINGTIPDSLCELKDLKTLDLSRNFLSGNLPSCWPNFEYLEVASLSFNELSGAIPNSIGGAYSLQWLHLNDNSLIGKLPSTLKNCTSLIILDVGGNRLSGKLPDWIGKDLRLLVVLRLRENELYGMIPSALCQLSQLQIIDLAENRLRGNMPHCFGNLSGMLITERLDIYLAEWMDESFRQYIKGVELEYTKNSILMVNLDLSSNYLTGEIPSEITTLSGLVGLNLSHNHLSGGIPTKIGELKSLESLDLSSNKLSGKIPESLSNLSSLSYLNMSHNNLSGQIPTGRQLQTLDDPSVYDGNPLLCGAPLLKKCHTDKATKTPNAENHGDTDDRVCLYAFIIAGFATGFWGVIGVLVIKTKWRQSYFEFIDMAVNRMLGY